MPPESDLGADRRGHFDLGAVRHGVLDPAKAEYGLPKVIRTNNGPGFAGRAMQTWAARNGVELRFIQPGSGPGNGVTGWRSWCCRGRRARPALVPRCPRAFPSAARTLAAALHAPDSNRDMLKAVAQSTHRRNPHGANLAAQSRHAHFDRTLADVVSPLEHPAGELVLG